MAIDPELLRHKEWLGFLQPVGLVVSPPALVKAQAIVNRNVVDLQQSLLSVISRDLQLVEDNRAWIFDFPAFVENVLGWEPSDLISGDDLKDLEVVLPDYGEILAPSYAVQDALGGASQNNSGWLMLIQVIAPAANLDEVDAAHDKSGKWSASPQAKFERLLRETGVPIGILCNGTDIRLVYAPKGESSGHLTFTVQAMCEVSGRLILGAMEMLLSAYRVFTAPPGRRLKDVLEKSRKYQAEVSTTLANQVVDALWELLRGFQMADAATNGRLLSELATQNPQHIYGGLITTLMRLVFLLYAEDEGLMPGDDLYQHNYAVSGLFEDLLHSSRMAADLMVSAFFEGTTQKQRDERLQAFLALLRIYDAEGLDVNPAKEGLEADAIIQAGLEGKTSKQRQQKLQDYGGKLLAYEASWANSEAVLQASNRLRNRKRGVTPFNWEYEFLEVFERENPGFDCVIGNPPFAGKNTIINGNAENYLNWLKEEYPESHGNSDLVAYFFRRAFKLLKQGGTLGLVATNTIAQGDTRSTSLRWICEQGGTIYNARKRVRWAGQAAVVVSVIHIYKGLYKEAKVLDGKEVPLISAFLFPKGGNNNPNTLLANVGKSFVGSYVLGMGFTFDDTNEDATSIAEMHRLIQEDPRNQERIFPYIGGEEVNSSPNHAHHRYVINFGEMSEAEARSYPDLMAIVEEQVKPKRLLDKREIYRRNWWQFCEKRVSLYKTITECDRVLVRSLTSKHFCFTFLDKGFVYDQTLIVFALPQFSTFTALSSRVHEVWANFFGASMRDDPRYNIGDCFETFPFPENWKTDANLEAMGKRYYEFRAELMVRNNEGLTQTYNRFHDPNELDPDILQLRQLHDECDRAVLAAYGWNDIQPQCEFLLDYEDEEEDDEESAKRQRKKPYRYRWNEATHDEVLARLLDLNQKRYEQEILGGKGAAGKSKGSKAKKSKHSDVPTLPGLEA